MSDPFNTTPESGQDTKGFLEGNNALSYTKTALAALLINIGAFSAQGQTQATTGKNTIELVTNTKAKADIDALMKKYSLKNLDDLSFKSPNEILYIRDELTTLLSTNLTSQYHLDPSLVKFRDEVRMYVDGYASETYDRSIYTTVVGRGDKLAKSEDKLAKSEDKLAKSEDKLAKVTQEVEDIKKIAEQFGIKK